jgi:GAF domain-containing protein
LAPPPRHSRVVALTAVLAAASAGLWTLLAPAPRPASAVGVVLLVAAAIAVDWWPLTLEHRGQTLHQTLSGIVVVFGLLFVSPVATLAARVCGTLVGYRFRWRAAPIKIAYNGVLATLEVWVAAAVLAAVAGGAGPLRPQAWLGIATALLAAELISFLLVLGVIRLTAGALRLDVVGDMVVALLYTSAISAAVAIPGAVVLAVEPAAAVALAAVVGLVARTNRARHALSERYRNLTSLYAFIDATTTAAGDVIPTLLAEAVRATGADRVTLLLAGGDAAAAYHLGAEGEPVRTTPADRDGVAALALSAPAGRLLARGEPRPLPALTGPPADQALLVSLSQGSLRGALLLEGRRGTLPDFDETDLQLARGMARHAAQALVTSRLVDELQASTETMERLALFDRDTGLPSRAGLLRSGVDVRGTVLALVEIGELDTVEGTFGHRAAGTVIKALADRLADADALGIRAAARSCSTRWCAVAPSASTPRCSWVPPARTPTT